MPTDEEKAREELVRKAQEEQERLEAEEGARQLQDEAVQAYEKTRRLVDEQTKKMKESFEEIQKVHKDAMKKITEATTVDFKDSWKRSMQSTAEGLVRMLNEAMSRGMRLSIDSVNARDFAPGLGRAGRAIAESLGASIGTALGAASGIPGGAQLGGQIGRIGAGGLSDELGMQTEGYNMLGARTANVAYSGQRFQGKDFEDIGRTYRTAVRDIVRDTGAVADQVGSTARAVSQLGTGFLEGGKSEVQFALATDRVLNLQPGRTLKMQTDIVTRYGESIGATRRVIDMLVDSTAEYGIVQQQTHSAIATTFSSSQTLANALDQIASSARNSGASVEALSGIALSFVKTMSIGAGSGQMRPDQIIESGSRIMRATMPSTGASVAEEAERSGIDRMLLEKTRGGRAELRGAQHEANRLGMPEAEAQQRLQTLLKIRFARGGSSSGAGMRHFANEVAGVHAMIRDSGGDSRKVQKLLEQRGLTGPDMIAMQSMYEELNRRGAYKGPHSASIMHHMLKEMRDDPRYKDTIGRMHGLTETAKEQGNAMQSTMDRLSNVMTGMSTWFNEQYWTKGRDAIAQAFGLGAKPSMLKTLGGIMVNPIKPPAPSDTSFSAAARRGAQNVYGYAPPSTAPKIERQEVHVSPEMITATRAEESRARSGLEVTGN